MLFPEKRFGLMHSDWFDDLFKDDFRMPKMSMSTDIKETDQGYSLEMNIPGFEKEDLKMELDNGYLTISAATSKENTENDKNGKLIRQERYSGSCSRSFYVGNNITEQEIKATYNNGVLSISIPKKEVQQIETKKYIPID